MRFKKTIAASAVALGVLSFGGAAMASGSGTSAPKAATEQSQSDDTDNVQDEVGDQTAPDNGAETTDATDATDATDGDNVQEGDQTSPDVPGEAEAAGESDGADGGHEDADGVDVQFGDQTDGAE